MRDVAEERLLEAQIKLLALRRSDDPGMATRSTALLRLVLHERPSLALESFMPREWGALIREWRDTSSRESWTFPPAPVVLPLQYIGGVPVLAVTVNGHSTAFALDTGASRTVLSSRVAGAIGVSTSPVSMRLQDAHGVVMRAPLAVVDVAVGGIRMQGHPVAVLDAAQLEFRSALGWFHGVLGWNAIRALRITLDNGRGALHVELQGPSLREARTKAQLDWPAGAAEPPAAAAAT